MRNWSRSGQLNVFFYPLSPYVRRSHGTEFLERPGTWSLVQHAGETMQGADLAL